MMLTTQLFLEDLLVKQDPLLWLTLFFFTCLSVIFFITVFRRFFQTQKTYTKRQLTLPLSEPKPLPKKKTQKKVVKPKTISKSKKSIEPSKKTESIDYQRLSGEDAIATQLDLAHAYLEMDDLDHAKEVLQNVIEKGTAAQQKEAQKLLKTI